MTLPFLILPQVEWEKTFSTTLVNLAHDPVHGLIFFFSNGKVFELSVVDEDKVGCF